MVDITQSFYQYLDSSVTDIFTPKISKKSEIILKSVELVSLVILISNKYHYTVI